MITPVPILQFLQRYHSSKISRCFGGVGVSITKHDSNSNNLPSQVVIRKCVGINSTLRRINIPNGIIVSGTCGIDALVGAT